MSSVPQSPALNYIISPTNHQVILNWFLPVNKSNNCEDIEIFTKCNYTEVLGIGYVGSNGTSSDNITEGSTGFITNTIIHTLSPFTRYNCYSIATNSRGSSNKSRQVPIQTLEDGKNKKKT